MAVIDEIRELAQDTYFTINNAENDDTDQDAIEFENNFIRSFNLWIREYETEAYWQPARVSDYELAVIVDTNQFAFDLPAEFRSPIFDRNKELKIILADGTVIARFSLVDPDQGVVDDSVIRENRATFVSGGRSGGGKVVLSRKPRPEEVGAMIVLDVVKRFPKLSRIDGTALDWVYNDQVVTLGIAKNNALADVTKVTLSPSFTQKYNNELAKAIAANAASTEIDLMQVDDFSSIGGIF